MVRIQLISPQEGYLDVKGGTVFPLNFSVAEIRDISQRNGKFSKTITLAGTHNNNALLNHYFNVNTVALTFDVNVLQRVNVIQNDVPILRNAYLQLLSVNRIADTQLVQGEQLVEYEVLIKDATANLFTSIADKELRDLSFSDLDHTYEAANVVTSFANTYTDGYKYILPYTPNTFYTLEQCKPAIYAIEYWDRIFASGGFTYQWNGDSLEHMRQLLIPYNGEAVKVSEEELDFLTSIATKTTQTLTLSQGVSHTTSGDTGITSTTEVQDDSASYNPTTGEYTSTVYSGNSGGFDVIISADYELILDNTSIGTAYLRRNGGTAPSQVQYAPYLGAECNGHTSWSVFGTQSTYVLGDSIPSGSTTIDSGTVTKTITMSPPYSPNIGEVIEGLFGVQVQNSFLARWKSTNSDSGSNVTVNVKLKLSDIRIEIKPRLTNVVYGSNIRMNDHVPVDIKQSDFIKSICKMFNLYMEADQFDENLIQVYSRDDYYDAGTVKDWNTKLARNKTNTIQFLPELNTKEMLFTYKEDKDAVNVGYTESTSEIYGQQKFTFDSEYIKGETKNELIFSPSPCAISAYGGVNPIWDGIAPKCNIRVLYDGGEAACNSYMIYDFGTDGETCTTYPAVTHFDSPYFPTYDINFGVCDYYFYQVPTLTNNNLFNTYYRRTMGQLNSGVMLTGLFALDAYDMVQLRMNDKIFLDGKYWNINKVIDYNPMVDGLTKVELISADGELQLPRFPVKPYSKPALSEASVGQPINADWQSSTGSTNTIEGASQAINSEYNNIKGNGIIIFGGKKNVASGTDITISNSSNNEVSGTRITLTNSDNNTFKNCTNVTVTNTSGVSYENLADCIIDRGMIVNGKDGISLISADKTITRTELSVFNGINASGGNILITLPSPYDLQAIPIYFKRTDTSANTVTIDASTNGGTIEGAASITLVDERGVMIYGVGNAYAVITDYNPNSGGGGGLTQEQVEGLI